MNWGAGANCFLLKAVHNYGKDWELVSTALQMISRTFLRDENLQDLSRQSCSLQYNYLIASTRQKYPNELDEGKLLKLAMDYYTAQRREKLHAARLELLKRIKIAEDDSEKLREGRYSEIPVSRLTIYRKRCRAFGITDVIGQKLGLEPLSPGTEAENQAIRDSLAVPELFNAGIGEEVTDARGGTWYPLRTSIREVFSETEKQNMHASMNEFLRAQAILSRRIGTEVPEDEASSIDTSSSVKTHPDVHELEPTLHSNETPLCRCTRSQRLSRDSLRTAGSDPIISPTPPTDPQSPSGSALVSCNDGFASPSITQSLNSSPGLSGIEINSPTSGRKSNRKGTRKRPLKSTPVVMPRVQATDSEPALSPLASDSGQLDEFSTTASSALALARRWRRSLLAAFSTICSHRHAYVFMQPVTEDIAPGYSSVVYEPVDLTSLRRRIESALSTLNSPQPPSSPTQILIDAATGFIRDLMLMFVNARMYNSQNHEVHQMAGDMFNDTMVELQPLWSVLVEDIPDFPPLPEPTKPVTQHTTGRTSLRQSTVKAAVSSMPSPSASQHPPRTPDPVTTKTPSSSIRPSKRSHPETPPPSSPLRKRHQSSGSDASGGHAMKNK